MIGWWEKKYYHFQTKPFLNSILTNQKNTEKFFFGQTKPKIIGLNYYDVQLTPTPSLGAEPLKVMYNYYYYPSTSGLGTSTAVPQKAAVVTENSLAYSEVITTGFRAKFAICNNSDFGIWTNLSSFGGQSSSSQLMLFSRNLITLTPQKSVEKVLNPQNINEVVDIQSDWVQSKKVAENILKVIAGASDSFSKDISIEIFGNPLIQIGDIITLSYGLKNIKNLIFFVQSVSQTFNNGLSTTIILNQIRSDGTVKRSLPSSYKRHTSLSLLPTITNIYPEVVSIDGGSEITIKGTNFVQDKTTIYVDGHSVDTTWVDSNTVTATTNAHDLGEVSIFVVSNGLSGQGFYGKQYKVTSVTSNGSDITYVINNDFNIGDVITITGIKSDSNPTAVAESGFNLKNVVVASGSNSSKIVVNHSLYDYIKYADITNVSCDGNYITFTSTNTFIEKDTIKISGLPSPYNVYNNIDLSISSATSTKFFIKTFSYLGKDAGTSVSSVHAISSNSNVGPIKNNLYAGLISQINEKNSNNLQPAKITYIVDPVQVSKITGLSLSNSYSMLDKSKFGANFIWSVTTPENYTSYSYKVVGSKNKSKVYRKIGKIMDPQIIDLTNAVVGGGNITYTTAAGVYFKGQKISITGFKSIGNPTGTAGAGFNLIDAIIANVDVKKGEFTVKNSLSDSLSSNDIPINNIISDGNTIRYFAYPINFNIGDVVTIKNVNPSSYNLSSVRVEYASTSEFRVNNPATGVYVSGGTVSPVAHATISNQLSLDDLVGKETDYVIEITPSYIKDNVEFLGETISFNNNIGNDNNLPDLNKPKTPRIKGTTPLKIQRKGKALSDVFFKIIKDSDNTQSILSATSDGSSITYVVDSTFKFFEGDVVSILGVSSASNITADKGIEYNQQKFMLTSPSMGSFTINASISDPIAYQNSGVPSSTVTGGNVLVYGSNPEITSYKITLDGTTGDHVKRYSYTLAIQNQLYPEQDTGSVIYTAKVGPVVDPETYDINVYAISSTGQSNPLVISNWSIAGANTSLPYVKGLSVSVDSLGHIVPAWTSDSHYNSYIISYISNSVTLGPDTSTTINSDAKYLQSSFVTGEKITIEVYGLTILGSAGPASTIDYTIVPTQIHAPYAYSGSPQTSGNPGAWFVWSGVESTGFIGYYWELYSTSSNNPNFIPTTEPTYASGFRLPGTENLVNTGKSGHLYFRVRSVFFDVPTGITSYSYWGSTSI